VCASIEAEYDTAFKQAVMCVTMFGASCQHKAPNGLACGCEVWVSSKFELDRIRGRWEAAGCKSCLRACPLIACLDPTNGVCGPNGSCVDRRN
jgi:hypothetical protein